MAQIERADAKHAHFADAIGKEEVSETEEFFSTENAREGKIAAETLIVTPISPNSKKKKTASALLGIRALELLLAPELLHALEDYGAKKGKDSAQSASMGKFASNESAKIEDARLPIFAINC